MKKSLVFLLSLCFCTSIAFSACGSNANSASGENDKQTIIRAYEEHYEVDTEKGDYAVIIEYYGKFDSGAIVALMSANCFDYPSVIGQETIAGYDFYRQDSYHIFVFYENQLYKLSEAYAQGFLTEEDVFEIVKIRCANSYNPEKALAWALKQRTILAAFEEQDPNAGKASIRNFYGLFENGAIVAMLDAENYGHMTVIETERIGEYDFTYSDSNRILVLYQNTFYPLKQAYENGLISDYDLQSIYLTHYGTLLTLYGKYSKFSFALTWNTYGCSSYDSLTGVLVKTKDAPNPKEFTTTYHLTEEQKRSVFNYFRTINFDAFPDVYEPCESISTPCITLVLTIRYGEKVKTITANCVDYDFIGKDESATTFLNACKYLFTMLQSTDAWQALPDYPYLYD